MIKQRKNLNIVLRPILFSLTILKLFLIQNIIIVDANSQFVSPDRRYVFQEDRKKNKFQKKKSKPRLGKNLNKAKKKGSKIPLDVDAKVIRKEGDSTIAEGGVSVSYQDSFIESDKMNYNSKTKFSNLKGNVRISDPGGEIRAEEIDVNLDTKEGTFKKSKINLEDSDFKINASKATRLKNDYFLFDDVDFTTCDCADDEDCAPWSFSSTHTEVQKDGYGLAENAVIRLYGVPVLYTPYLPFPAKSKRQSGLIAPRVTYNNRRGFIYYQPLFLNFDDSFDSTITPLIETNTRYGSGFELRKQFTKDNYLNFGFTGVNESLRRSKRVVDGNEVDSVDLQGTQLPQGMDTIPENRSGGYLRGFFSTPKDSHSVSLIIDAKYAGDDVFLRELEGVDIDDTETANLNSEIVMRTPLSNSFTLTGGTLLQQNLTSNDDKVLQRLPYISLNGYHPLEEVLGVNLRLTDQLKYTRFSRKENYDGSKLELYEKLTKPFYFGKYLEGSVYTDARLTKYSLSNTVVSKDSNGQVESSLPSSSDRLLPGIGGSVGTTFEKVVSSEALPVLKYLGELGQSGRYFEIAKFKHTLEPSLGYRFIAKANQKDNPDFLDGDRLRNRNIGTINLTQRWFAKLQGRDENLYGESDLAPRAEDVQPPSLLDSLESDFMPNSSTSMTPIRDRSGIREMANFSISQPYDFNRSRVDYTLNDRGQKIDQNGNYVSTFPWIATKLTGSLFLNEYLALRARYDYNLEDSRIETYKIDEQFTTKRGDALRLSFTFNKEGTDPLTNRVTRNGISQVVPSAEFVLTDRFKLGFFGKFDFTENEFTEKKSAMRYYSSCNCYTMDVVLADRINPDEQRLTFEFNLLGLGELNVPIFNKIGSDGSN